VVNVYVIFYPVPGFTEGVKLPLNNNTFLELMDPELNLLGEMGLYYYVQSFIFLILQRNGYFTLKYLVYYDFMISS
jgi:hypothetical protein